MNNRRSAALAVAACAASLSVAACSAGITTATPPATRTPASTRSASVAAAASSPASSGRMIAIGRSLSFPVPAGAKVAENVADNQQIVIIFGGVTPAKVLTFYTTALPQGGYTISANSLINQGGGTVAFIQFSGHGYKGSVDTLSKFNGSDVSLNGLGTKNVTTVSLVPK